jgi:hypothetical protein
MKKTDVFPMYLINPKQQILYNKKKYDFVSYSNWTETCHLFTTQNTKKSISKEVGYFGIQSCQLILKSIKDISGEDLIYYNEKTSRFIFFNVIEHYQREAAELTFWLIKNGYAFTEELFKLKIAVRK